MKLDCFCMCSSVSTPPLINCKLSKFPGQRHRELFERSHQPHLKYSSRSLGFFNIRHCTLQCNLSVQLPQFNRMINRHASKPRPKQTCKAASHAKHARSAEPDQYPWLDSKDPRRTMTDEQILCKYIDLSESTLDEHGKAVLMDIILEHKKAFSLRDEIGECPNIKIDIDVIDDSPFFVRPFPISEEDKPIMD